MLQPIESEVEPLLLLAMSMSHNAQLKYPVANKLILNVSAMVKISPKPVHLKMPKNSVLIL